MKYTNKRWLLGLSILLGLGLVGGASNSSAAEYLLRATGSFEASSSTSDSFDGTTSVDPHLPSLFDTGRLEGGSFVATYRFSTTPPPASGAIANY